MEKEQDKVSVTSSPGKLLKRAKTWEISDSENEEESVSVMKSDIKDPDPQINTELLRDEESRTIVAGEISLYEQESPDVDTETKDLQCGDLKAGTEDSSGCIKEDNEQPSVEINTSTLSLSLPGSNNLSTVKKAKRRKSPEELQAERAQTEERKREKEAKKLENERIRNLEKEEKDKRKASALALKLLRPDQCGKYMTVQVDAGLLQAAGSDDVLEALRAAGYNCSIEPHTVPCSIMWRREMPIDWTCVEGLELCKGEEDEMMILVEPKDFLTSVHGYIQAPVTSRDSETPESVFGMAKKYPEKKITLVVLGLQDYRRCQRLSRKMERHSLEATDGCDSQDSQSESPVTRRQIDEVLVYLQLHQETEVLYLDTWKEFGQHVCAMTKSLAQRPFRMHWEAQTYSFCTSTGTWRGWGPRGSLSGLPLTWRRQIQQFNRVSPAMAAAITEAYPSPQLLLQAYAECSTERKRQSLLCALRVPRKAGAVEDVDDQDEHGQVTQDIDQAPARERRIGPDLSRRIWLFMSSTNPELVLDLSS
ncbi:structure-specific endonuclease subunit EME2 [Mixophyes fleayi]|uniref:structure-specific endonuclease subunit EME2 n=1 Tax=Mixophyes fleayi TaxID=3061075 RepID=UPI003F4DDEE2